MELETDISRLKALQTDYDNRTSNAQDIRDDYAEKRENLTSRIEALVADGQEITQRGQLPVGEHTQITLQGITFRDRTDAGKALGTICNQFHGDKASSVQIGEIHGFPITLNKTPLTGEIYAVLQGNTAHRVGFTVSASHNLKKLETAILTVDKQLYSANEQLSELDRHYKLAVEFLDKPFTHTDELSAKIERHAAISAELRNETAEKAKSKGKEKSNVGLFNAKNRDTLTQAYNKARERETAVQPPQSPSPSNEPTPMPIFGGVSEQPEPTPPTPYNEPPPLPSDKPHESRNQSSKGAFNEKNRNAFAQACNKARERENTEKPPEKPNRNTPERDDDD
jgi:chromosome segregation ATPase